MLGKLYLLPCYLIECLLTLIFGHSGHRDKLKSKLSSFERNKLLTVFIVIHINASGWCIFHSINLKFNEKAIMIFTA